jgi:hypothetical protein
MIIGERYNVRGVQMSENWDRLHLEPDRWWKIMSSMKAFGPRSWNKLKRLGLDESMRSMNLLGPSSLPGAWDYDVAQKCAGIVLDKLMDNMPLILCCGIRVAAAFGRLTGDWHRGLQLGERNGHFVRIPHPSGRNLQWNDSTLISVIQERLSAHLPHPQSTVRERLL